MYPGLVEQSPTITDVRTYLEGLTTIEGRLGVSALIILLLVFFGASLVPWLVSVSNGVLRNRILTEQSQNLIDILNDYVPTTLGAIITRSLQVVILFAGTLAILVVWGLVDIAITVFQYASTSLPFLSQLIITVVLFFFAYIALNILEDAVTQYSKGADRITKHQEEIILRMGHVGILIFAFMGALTLWGYDLSGLLVGAGFLGIVVGLAARQTLGSMIAGFVLMFSRPFTIGDWVEVGGHEGIVTNITIMNTRIQNFDGESIIIPNDVVGNQPITNRSKQGSLRIRVEVGIDYAADPERAEELVIEVLDELDSVTNSPPPRVVPTGFGDSAVVLEMRFWIDQPNPPNKWRAITDAIHGVKDRFAEEGIKIPYPQRELSGRAETGGFRVRGSTAQVDSPDEIEAKSED